MTVPGEIALQRAYYATTAADYDVMHLGGDPEHRMAMGWLAALVGSHRFTSLLDVGSGTGRVLRQLRGDHDLRVCGIEPVEELRRQGHARGLSEEELRLGDALALDFPDNSFDVVCEFAVLHHIRDHGRAVAEMCRVAKRAVFLSDSNNFGQGGLLKRTAKQAIRAAGLWPACDWLATRGKGYHWSKGDGVFYSYSVFDDLDIVADKFPNLHFLSTQPSGPNLFRSAGHVAVFATAGGAAG